MKKEEERMLRAYNKLQSQNKKDWKTVPNFCKCNDLLEILIPALLELNNDKLWQHIEKLKELERVA